MLRLRPPPWALLLAAALCNALLLLAVLLFSSSDFTRTCATLNRRLHHPDEPRPRALLAALPGSGSGYLRAALQAATGQFTGAVGRADPAPSFPLKGGTERVLLVASPHLNNSGVAAERVVHLVRNPFAHVATAFMLSEAGARYKRTHRLPRDEWEQHVWHSAIAWRAHVQHWRAARGDRPYLLVRYEDLVAHRHATLRTVLRFLDVDADAAPKRVACAAKLRVPALADHLELFSNAQRRWLHEFTRVERAALAYNASVPLTSRRDFIVPGTSDMGFPLQCRPTSVFSRAIDALHATLRDASERSRREETAEARERRLSGPPLLLSWNRDDWMGWLRPGGFFSEWQGVHITKRPSRCRWSRDRAELGAAAMVLFSAIRHQNTHQSEWCNATHDLPTWRGHWQTWGALNYETAQQFSILSHERHAALYDVRIGWERTAHFGISMNCPFPTNRTERDPPPPKRPDRLVAYFASRCFAQERDAYAAELMRHIPVDSYGQCLNNRRLLADEERRWPRNWGAKIEALSTYYFTLAFENAEYEHWVTEKMPQAVFAGTVPVYWGAPDVHLFAPGPRAVIRTADFASPRHLAAYLHYLVQNQTAYAEYFEWKQAPELSAGWREHRANCAFFAQEKICDAAIARQQAERDEWATRR